MIVTESNDNPLYDVEYLFEKTLTETEQDFVNEVLEPLTKNLDWRDDKTLWIRL